MQKEDLGCTGKNETATTSSVPQNKRNKCSITRPERKNSKWKSLAVKNCNDQIK